MRTASLYDRLPSALLYDRALRLLWDRFAFGLFVLVVRCAHFWIALIAYHLLKHYKNDFCDLQLTIFNRILKKAKQ